MATAPGSAEDVDTPVSTPTGSPSTMHEVGYPTGAPAGSSSSSSPLVQKPKNLSYTVECYENERWFPLSGWCPKRLPNDRPHFSSKDGKRELDPLRWTPPEGYVWISNWAVDKEHRDGTDPDGWRYAFAWGMRFKPQMSGSTCVRRRRWIRTMIRAPTSSSMPPTTAAVPLGTVAVNNESFDVCSLPLSAVAPKPVPQTHTTAIEPVVARSAAAHPTGTAAVKVAAANSTPASTSTNDTAASRVDKDTVPVTTAPPSKPTEPVVADASEVPEATVALPAAVPLYPEYDMTTYFAERQATSIVIGRAVVRHAAETGGEADLPPPVAASAGKPVVEFVCDEEENEDMQFYGIRSTQSSVMNRGQAHPASTSDGDMEAYSFQKTLSEIVEDVERRGDDDDGGRMEPPPSSTFGLRPAVALPGDGQFAAHTFPQDEVRKDDEDDDALFSSVFQHFVSTA